MVKSLTQSLAHTLDVFNEAWFNGTSLSAVQTNEIAKFLLSRFEQPDCYHGLFAPTVADFAEPIRLFTGEKISTRAATAHILSEETLRCLNHLQSKDKTVKPVLKKASKTLECFITEDRRTDSVPIGRYCCAPCSVSLWRHAASSKLSIAPSILESAASLLKKSRLPNGRWHGYPFYYTLLALLEFPADLAKNELKHAAGACERVARQKPRDDFYHARRIRLCARILELI